MKVRMHHGIYGVIAIILSFTHISYSWQTIACKDGMRSTTTFSFPFKMYRGLEDLTYCYALEPGKSNEYAICYLRESENTIMPYAPEKIKCDGVKNQLNPLYNSGIKAITNLDGRNLVVALNTSEPKVYGLSLADEAEVLTLSGLTDTLGKPVDQPICALAGSQTKAFIAVKGNGKQKFGEDGSGIALIAFERQEIEEEVSEKAYEELKKKAQDHDEAALEEITQKITTDKDGKYRKKSIVKKLYQQNIVSFTADHINKIMKLDIAEVDDSVVLHWNDHLKCLYVGMGVKSHESKTAKALALYVCHFDKTNKLVLAPFFATNLIEGNQAIAGVGSNLSLSIRAIQNMVTSTRLDYCIAMADSQNSCNPHTCIYALP